MEQSHARELSITQAGETLNTALAEHSSTTAPMADELREAIANFDQDVKSMEDYLAQLKATKQNPEEWNQLPAESQTKIDSQITELEASIAAIKKRSAPTLNRARQVSGEQQQLGEKIQDIKNQNTNRAREKSFTVRKWNKLIEFLKARFVEVKADPVAVKEALAGLAARIKNLREQANEQGQQLTLAPAPIYENIEDIAEQVAVTLSQTQSLFDDLQKMQSTDQSIEQKIMQESIIKIKDELQHHQDRLQEYTTLSKEELAVLLRNSLETLQETLANA